MAIRKCFVGLVIPLLVFGVASVAAPLNAQEIRWNVDADGFWHEVGNWDSDPVLPGPSNDVTIDRPGFDLTITHSQGTTSINSLLSNENLVLSGGSLTVAGPSQVNNAFTANTGVSLTANGPSAAFTANGSTTIDGSSLYALNGGAVNLSQATSYTDGRTGNTTASFKADGAGSKLDLSSLTTVAPSTGGFSGLNIQALSGGQVDLGGATSIDGGNAAILADGANSLVDLSALTSFAPTVYPWWYYSNSSIQARNGGTVLIDNLTTLNAVRLTIDGTGTMATGQLTTYTNGIATVSGVSPDFSGMTDVTGSSFKVTGVSLDLSQLTELSHVTVNMDGASVGGVSANLSNVTALPYTTIQLKGGATTVLDNATNIDGASFIVEGGVTLALPNATSYTDARTGGTTASFKADGANSKLDLSGLTIMNPSTGGFSGLNIQALSGGEVDLGGITSIDVGTTVVLADGANSLVDFSSLTSFDADNNPWSWYANSSIQARNGGTVLMENLTTLDAVRLMIDGTGTMATGQISTYTNGIATVSGVSPDFSGMTDVTGSTFNITGVSLDLSQLTELSHVTVNMDGASVGGVSANLSNVTALPYTTIQLKGGATTVLDNATNIDGASFIVEGGVTLALPNATSYTDARTGGTTASFKADGANSKLDLSGLTIMNPSTGGFSGLNIQALSGGEVDLGGITSIDVGTTVVLADGANSLVDLSSLTSFTPTLYPWWYYSNSSIQARNGGTVELSQGTTTVANSKVIVGPSGTINVGTLGILSTASVEVTDGMISAAGIENAGTLLNNGTISGNVLNQSGGLLTGSGIFEDAVTIAAGSLVSPGDSPGTMTWGSGLLEGGGTLLWEINDATGIAGTNWDLIAIDDTLSITATALNPFLIDMESLLPDNTAGLLGNFDNMQSYDWTFLTAANGISGFSADYFLLDYSGFQNDLGGGSFFVSQVGNSLNLNFQPIPEPSTFVVWGIGIITVLAYSLRRRKRAA